MKKLITDTVITVSIVIAFLCLAIWAEGSELTAPETCSAGELAVIQSDEPATWAVYPNDYKTSYYIANDGKTCVFASPQKGTVTIIAATVTDGKSVITTHTLYNGVAKGTDNKDVVEPEPDLQTIEGVVKSEAKGKKSEQLTALADSFEFVISGINRGTIQTPAGARETFRSTWIQKATAVNPETINELSDLVSTISDKVDNSTLEALKSDYEKVVNALRECTTTAKVPEKDTKPATGNCPTGTCPNGQCGNTRYRWGYYQ